MPPSSNSARAWAAGVRALALSYAAFLALIRFVRLLALSRRTPDGTAAAAGQVAARFLEEQGPAFIKLGQILSTRRDLLGDPITGQLARLRDALPAVPLDTVVEAFRQEFGISLDDAFRDFDPVPVASASVATVYRARLHDGTLVAVKVRRPDVAARILVDLDLCEALGRLMQRLPPFRLVPIAAAISACRVCIERQLDFRLEAAANRRLRSVFARDPDVLIPTLVDHLCGGAVITMTFVDAFDPASARVERAPAALDAALRAVYRMIFIEGFVHCDLHQGNLRLMPDGRVALVDFGFIAELARVDRLRFAEFFYAMATGDGPRCAQITVETAAFVPADFSYEQFEGEITTLIRRMSGRTAADFEVATFVGQLFDIQRRFGVMGTTSFTMAIVALLVFEGIAREMGGELDFQRAAIPFVLQATIHRCERESVALDSTSPDLASLESRFAIDTR